jgi:hypothetical protein
MADETEVPTTATDATGVDRALTSEPFAAAPASALVNWPSIVATLAEPDGPDAVAVGVGDVGPGVGPPWQAVIAAAVNTIASE